MLSAPHIGDMERRTFTLRLSGPLYDALADLSGILHRSMNDLAAEAVASFVSKASKDEARDLERTLARLAAYAEIDPSFEHAIDRFAKAEVASDDPLEGQPFQAGSGDQRKLRDLLANG